jgi:signal transduction histidine kinase
LRCRGGGSGDGKGCAGVELRVRDDGRGFDPSQVPAERLGLSIVRERAQAIGARLVIESGAGRGTELVVEWGEGRDEG